MTGSFKPAPGITVPLGRRDTSGDGVEAWYDTRDGLEGRLKADLNGLRDIVTARYKAGYERNERMRDWCILGMFYTDSCGNFSRITSGAPADAYEFMDYDTPEMPDVMTKEETNQYTGRWVATMGTCVPPEGARCDRCGSGWTMRTIRDFVWHHNQPPRHESCERLRIIEREQKEIQSVIEKSGIPVNGMYMIPNQYHPDPDIYGPWFMVETPAGRIKIGWRKRVINIDWSDTGLNVQGGDVRDKPGDTAGPTYVHAWGSDKAVEILQKIWATRKAS